MREDQKSSSRSFSFIMHTKFVASSIMDGFCEVTSIHSFLLDRVSALPLRFPGLQIIVNLNLAKNRDW